MHVLHAMAELVTEKSSRAPQQNVGEEIRLIRGVLGGILADDSLTLPTEGNKKCLDMAKSMAQYYSSVPTEASLEFARWLVVALNAVIVAAQKRGKPNELNQERLWRKFNLLTVSDSFIIKWQDFLKANHLEDQPVFYQHFTELFDSLIQKKLRAAQPDLWPDEVEIEGDTCEPLSFEEENGIRYMGGYVVRKLREHPDCAEFNELLNEMVSTEDMLDENSPSAAWTNAINRGGLVKITADAYQVFLAVESCVRRYLTIKKVSKMDKSFKRYLTNMVVNDSDVLFHWCMAGFEKDENASCLQQIVKKWITIRGFSFATCLMEMYKQENKKGTGKSKSLRTKLYCDK